MFGYACTLFSLLLHLLLLSSQASFEDGEKERERILHGLETILDDGDGLVEAREFLYPVDFMEESGYCKLVAYPTSLSTIINKLKKKFYRYV